MAGPESSDAYISTDVSTDTTASLKSKCQYSFPTVPYYNTSAPAEFGPVLAVMEGDDCGEAILNPNQTCNIEGTAAKEADTSRLIWEGTMEQCPQGYNLRNGVANALSVPGDCGFPSTRLAADGLELRQKVGDRVSEMIYKADGDRVEVYFKEGGGTVRSCDNKGDCVARDYNQYDEVVLTKPNLTETAKANVPPSGATPSILAAPQPSTKTQESPVTYTTQPSNNNTPDSGCNISYRPAPVEPLIFTATAGIVLLRKQIRRVLRF